MIAMSKRLAAPGSGGTGRRRRLIGAAGLLLVTVVVLLVALNLTTVTFLAPSPRPDRVSPRHVIWAPGVLTAGAATLAVLMSLGWLIWNWVTRPPSRWWWSIASLIAVVGLVTATAASIDRPHF